MLIRSKAPLRLGLAGGGTDVSPYSDNFGGVVLNVTINLYAYCTIEPTDDGLIEFVGADIEERFIVPSCSFIEPEGNLKLHKGVFNRIMRLFNGDKHLSFRLTTISDAPVGSGLGSSSTMIVAMIKAYSEWLKIPLSDYEVANLAYEIERIDLCLSGGKQDQYAASFGGLNFIQFYKDGKVLVNPLKIKDSVKFELESQLILYFTWKSRESAKIIDQQVKNTKANNVALDSMHKVKEYAYEMKRAILLGDFDLLYQCINNGWKEKKKMADSISNQKIDETYDFVMNNGGFAARISGAGGGGFMLILCDPVRRSKLIEKLREKEGKVLITSLTEVGATAWTI